MKTEDDDLDDLPQSHEEMRERLPFYSYRKKIKIAETIILPNSFLDQISDALEECRTVSAVSKEPLCLFISGDTGLGKSTSVEQYMDKFEQQVLPNKVIIPVIYVRIDSPPTHHSVCFQLSHFISPVFDDSGAIHKRTATLIDMSEDSGVQMYIIDELQNYENIETSKGAAVLANWLKNLALNSRIPIILIGMPSSKAFLSLNAQLSRRFAWRIRIKPISYETNDEQEKVHDFLAAADLALPLQNLSDLHGPGKGSRIYYAANGYIGYVMTMLRRGSGIALKKGEEILTMETLSEAFERHVHAALPEKINPFREQRFSPELALELMEKEGVIKRHELAS
jgi:hypothetical protein